jgi:hypothetical protein
MAITAVITPKLPITLAPSESTFMIKKTPIKIAIAAIKNAKIFITASGKSRCGKKVSANEIGPPKAVSETIRLASRARDSKSLLTQNLQYFQHQQQ